MSIITKEDIKQHNDIDTNEDDELLDLYINGITEFLENKIGREIEKNEHTEYFNGDEIGGCVILKNSPVVSITSFQYRTGSYSDPTWNDFNEDYYQLDEDGIIEVDTMYSGKRNIKVVYNAGYDDDDEDYESIPYSLKLAAMKLVSKIYNKKLSEGYKVEEVSNARIEWDKFISDDILELINPYRARRI